MLNIKKLYWTVRSLPNRLYNWVILKYRKVETGKNLQIHGRIHLVSNTPEGVVIGNNVRINSGKNANPIGGDVRTTFFAKGKGKIHIGDGCGISNATIFACESVEIGNDVLIGGGVKIYDTDFHWLDFEKRMSEPGGVTRPVNIQNGVFIGAHSIILKGVTIGEKAVVGAGSVVTKDIPSGEIWGGNPARFIRKNEN